MEDNYKSSCESIQKLGSDLLMLEKICSRGETNTKLSLIDLLMYVKSILDMHKDEFDYRVSKNNSFIDIILYTVILFFNLCNRL